MTEKKMLDGRLAVVTGAAGGQGRSHVERFLREGANVLALDVLGPESPEVESVDGRQLMQVSCDVRDAAALDEAVRAAVQEFGPPRVVVANAAINGARGPAWEFDEDEWERLISINLSGAWKTISAAVPAMLEGGEGGSIIVIGSTCGIKGYPTTAHYTAAKHALVGLARVFAAELAKDMIRVNVVHPTMVNTDLIHNEAMYRAFVPEGKEPTRENFEEYCRTIHKLPTPWVEPEDVTEMVLWLASDLSRFVTSAEFVLDAGATQ